MKIIDYIVQMCNNTCMDYITIVEMALLGIIAVDGEMSGYQINKIVRERGYKEWAGIGSTSVYLGLKKLDKKEYIAKVKNIEKTGKGPIPNRYYITQKGLKVLQAEAKKSLADCNRYDAKYDLAIAVMPVLTSDEIISSLLEKKNKLLSNMEKVKKEKYRPQGAYNLPIQARLLFERSFMLTQMEVDFIDHALTKIT